MLVPRTPPDHTPRGQYELHRRQQQEPTASPNPDRTGQPPHHPRRRTERPQYPSSPKKPPQVTVSPARDRQRVSASRPSPRRAVEALLRNSGPRPKYHQHSFWPPERASDVLRRSSEYVEDDEDIDIEPRPEALRDTRGVRVERQETTLLRRGRGQSSLVEQKRRRVRVGASLEVIEGGSSTTKIVQRKTGRTRVSRMQRNTEDDPIGFVSSLADPRSRRRPTVDKTVWRPVAVSLRSVSSEQDIGSLQDLLEKNNEEDKSRFARIVQEEAEGGVGMASASWTSKKLCRYPQKIRVSVRFAPDAAVTDLHVGLLFAPYFVSRRVEVVFRSSGAKATKKKKPRRSELTGPRAKSHRHRLRQEEEEDYSDDLKTMTLIQRVIQPKSDTDVAHEVHFPVNLPEVGSKARLDISLETPIENPEMNVFMQVSLRSVSIIAKSRWEDDLRVGGIRTDQFEKVMEGRKKRAKAVTKEDIEEEFRAHYRMLDDYSKSKIVGLVKQKLKYLREENFEAARLLRERRLDRIVELGQALRSLERTKHKCLLKKQFKAAQDLQTEIYSMRKDVDAIVSGKEASRVRDKAMKLPMSLRNAQLIQRQKRAIHGVLNVLEQGLESENVYFPELAARKEKRDVLFFREMSAIGFGESKTVEEEAIRRSLPARVWFDRTQNRGFGFGCDPFTGQGLPSGQFVVSSRPTTGQYFDQLGEVALGSRPESSTSSMWLREYVAEGLGEPSRPVTTESEYYFGRLEMSGLGSRPESRDPDSPLSTQSFDEFY